METEEWRDIVGYEGLYQVSEFGDIKSFVRRCNRFPPKGILKTGKSRGYLTARLTDANKKLRAYLVHRIVAVAFIGECPEGMEVNHKDRNKHNNHYSNLEYVTHLENMRHTNQLYKRRLRFGENHTNSKLTEALVIEIRKRHASEEISQTQLAKEYDMDQSTISQIILRKTWKHVK